MKIIERRFHSILRTVSLKVWKRRNVYSIFTYQAVLLAFTSELHTQSAKRVPPLLHLAWTAKSQGRQAVIRRVTPSCRAEGQDNEELVPRAAARVCS